jgi:hypothetical protein
MIVKISGEDNAAVKQLFNVLHYLVNDMDGPWTMKRGVVLGLAKEDDRDKDNLMEFLSWFDTEDSAA